MRHPTYGRDVPTGYRIANAGSHRPGLGHHKDFLVPIERPGDEEPLEGHREEPWKPPRMKIIDDTLMASLRGRRCEVCEMISPPTCGHHILTRGAGRVDIPENLICLCVLCHDDAHRGELSKEALFQIVAEREGVRADGIEPAVQHIRRLDKRDFNGLRAVLQSLRGPAHPEGGQGDDGVPPDAPGPAPDGGPGGLADGEAERWRPF